MVLPGEKGSLSLHVFADASEKAHGAVIYALCIQSNGEITSNIVISKSRVAPLKSTSIPRLELCGAVLGLSLAKSVTNIMKVDMGKVTFWIDNMNVLYWIHNQSRLFKSFMANRVGEIQTHTKPSQW